jgi:hypothetical protein
MSAIMPVDSYCSDPLQRFKDVVKDGAPNRPNEHPMDKNLVGKLMEERDAIVSWIVRGAIFVPCQRRARRARIHQKCCQGLQEQRGHT